MDNNIQEIVSPSRLWSRAEIPKEKPVPRDNGVYGWYFKDIPGGIPIDDCTQSNGLTLLYVGLSPSAPPKNGKPPSKQNLRTRIQGHMTGNAEGSTLRLSLGCLLSEQLGIQLRRVGSGNHLLI